MSAAGCTACDPAIGDLPSLLSAIGGKVSD
jgi:hypothetical protein